MPDSLDSPTFRLVHDDTGEDAHITPDCLMQDFRGRRWAFVGVSKEPGFSNNGLDYSNGKLLVRDPDPNTLSVREFYPSVFNLRFVMEGEGGEGREGREGRE